MSGYGPQKGVRTQVFDRDIRRGNMLVSGKIRLYAIQATRDRPPDEDGRIFGHRPFLARAGHHEIWSDSIKHAELWTTAEEVRDVIAGVDWGCTVEPVAVTLYIGKVEPV